MFEQNKIIKTFSNACFIIALMFSMVVIYLELTGQNGTWLSYRTMEFIIYGVFSLGVYKIITLLNQLIGEMKFFRHHYILKDTHEAEVLKKQREKENE